MSTDIDKLEVADEMMESAIESFFDKERYFSALNLAGAAQEIYGKWVRASGGKDLPSQSLDIMEKVSKASGAAFSRREYQKIGSHAKNTIKHLDGASDRYTIIAPHFDSYLQMIEAFAEHKRLKRPATENINRFNKYIQKTKKYGRL